MLKTAILNIPKTRRKKDEKRENIGKISILRYKMQKP